MASSPRTSHSLGRRSSTQSAALQTRSQSRSRKGTVTSIATSEFDGCSTADGPSRRKTQLDKKLAERQEAENKERDRERRKALLKEKRLANQLLVQVRHAENEHSSKVKRGAREIEKVQDELERLEKWRQGQEERLKHLMQQLIEEQRQIEEEFREKHSEADEIKTTLDVEQEKLDMEYDEKQEEVRSAEADVERIERELRKMDEDMGTVHHGSFSRSRDDTSSARGTGGLSKAMLEQSGEVSSVNWSRGVLDSSAGLDVSEGTPSVNRFAFGARGNPPKAGKIAGRGEDAIPSIPMPIKSSARSAHSTAEPASGQSQSGQSSSELTTDRGGQFSATTSSALASDRGGQFSATLVSDPGGAAQLKADLSSALKTDQGGRSSSPTRSGPSGSTLGRDQSPPTFVSGGPPSARRDNNSPERQPQSGAVQVPDSIANFPEAPAYSDFKAAMQDIVAMQPALQSSITRARSAKRVESTTPARTSSIPPQGSTGNASPAKSGASSPAKGGSTASSSRPPALSAGSASQPNFGATPLRAPALSAGSVSPAMARAGSASPAVPAPLRSPMRVPSAPMSGRATSPTLARSALSPAAPLPPSVGAASPQTATPNASSNTAQRGGLGSQPASVVRQVSYGDSRVQPVSASQGPVTPGRGQTPLRGATPVYNTSAANAAARLPNAPSTAPYGFFNWDL